ncbi:MAG: toxin ParE2 [Thermoanaerobaculia bacterium]|nr:toxin ParE2 [Thermoanaerobaculia bacterium]
MKPLQVIAPAEAEFREVTAWYRERDPRVADRFAAEARKTLELIEQFPRIGGLVDGIDDRDVRRMPIRSFPYSVVFVDLADRIEVVAFAHYRRRPGYFISRLSKS